MKYKVNPEGIQALNALQKELKNQMQAIAQCAVSLQSQIDGNQQGAGPHFNDIQAMVYQITDISARLEEPIEEINEGLADLAESYQEIIDSKIANGTAQTPATAGAAAYSGSGSNHNSPFGSNLLDDDQYTGYCHRDAGDLSDRERMVIGNYTGTTYSGMNGRLRKDEYGNPNVPVSLAYDGQITVMTEALDRKELPRDCDLFRGVGKPDYIFGSDIDTMSIGELNDKYCGSLWRDKSFGSTSTNLGVAEKFSTGTIFEITAPKGARGAFVGDVSNYHYEEREVILQRGTIYSIDGIYEKGGYLVVQMTARGRKL